jgi:uncharacterized oxidoreductase
MPNISAERLREIGTGLLDAVGSPHERSQWVTETLVRANLAGHDSHGVMRLPQYLDQARQGQVQPAADIVITRETACTASIDARRSWGQVAAREPWKRRLRWPGRVASAWSPCAIARMSVVWANMSRWPRPPI